MDAFRGCGDRVVGITTDELNLVKQAAARLPRSSVSHLLPRSGAEGFSQDYEISMILKTSGCTAPWF
jgi:hypothetical protein